MLEVLHRQGRAIRGEITMRPVRIIATLLLAATAGLLTVAAAPAWATSTSTAVVVQASPNPVVAGQSVTLSGSVGPEGAASDCADLILYSEAFTLTNDPTSGPPVYTTAKRSGAFSATTRIPRAKAAGTYPIYLRCGGATVGGGRLVVQAAPPAKVQVRPNPVVAGHPVTVSGSVGRDRAGAQCARGVTLYSKAFVQIGLGELPSVTAAVKPDGTFTVSTTIPRSRSAGAYRIVVHCGELVGGTTLAVQAPPTLQVSPRSVTAGDTVTVSGSLVPAPADSACATSVLLLSDAFVHTDDFAGVPAITAAVKAGGDFAVTTRIPSSKAAGTYPITGRCGGGNIGVSATLVVRAAPPPTTTPAPTPPSPGGDPQAPTPAAASPAGPPAADLAGRWVIPGLAAVGASTLAALGLWLGYRRRHPATLSR
jgi:hypothetical protein